MSTAALQRIADVLERIEAKMPDKRERAELAALTGILSHGVRSDVVEYQIGNWAISQAAALLQQRQAESEGE